MSYVVSRISPEGYTGYKHFHTEKEAREWLESDSAREDRKYGFKFRLIEHTVKVGPLENSTVSKEDTKMG